MILVGYESGIWKRPITGYLTSKRTILGPICPWDRAIYATFVSFYCKWWCMPSMVHMPKIFWKKQFDCIFCKAIFQIFISMFFFMFFFFGGGGGFIPSCFGALIESKHICMYPFVGTFVSFYCLKRVLTLEMIENSIMNNKCLRFGP